MADVIAAIYHAALMVCRFNWELFMAREERGAGHADRVAGHLKAASDTMDALRKLLDVWMGVCE